MEKVERLDEAMIRLHGEYAELLRAYKKAPEHQKKAIRVLLGIEPDPFTEPISELTPGLIIPVKKHT